MPLPSNRFDKMETSTWWINPSKENPAYKHGKFAFAPEIGGRAAFLCGLHVEKGFGSSVGMFLTSTKMKRLLIRDDWQWNQFVRDLASGRLDTPMAKIERATNAPSQVLVQAYYCTDFGEGDFDPYGGGEDWDQVWFSVADGKLTVDVAETTTTHGILKEAARAADLKALGVALSTVPKAEWVWINVWLGQIGTLDPSGRQSSSWLAPKIYTGVLEPLRPWFG